MARMTKPLTSIGQFIELVSRQASEWRKHWEKVRSEDNTTAISWLPWFRGEPSVKVNFPLRPGLYRLGMSEGDAPQRIDILLECEGELRVEFKRCVGQLMTEGHPPRNKWEIYFLMQHYDVPTRLLDWTDGALMALHFAISRRGGDDDTCGKENPAVYMLDPWSLNAEAFKHCELVSESAQAVGVALPDWRAAKPYLKGEFSSDKLGLWCPLAIDPSHFSRRIAAQRSHFTIFGRDPDGLMKAANKNDVRLRPFEFDGTEIESLKRALRVCGISESVAYPDLGGLGRELKQVLTGYLPERFPKH